MFLRVLTAYFFSKRKWRKMWLLSLELIKQIQFVTYQKYRLIEKSGQPEIQESSTNTWSYKGSVRIPKEVYKLNKPTSPQDHFAENGYVETSYEYGISTIHGATTYTNGVNRRSVFDSTRRLMTHYSVGSNGSLFSTQTSIGTTRKLSGLTANLYGSLGMTDGNYGHWMIDGLSRLLLILKYHSIDEFDFFIVPPLTFDFHKESLQVFGISEEKLVELRPLDCLYCEKLVCTTPPRGKSSSICPGWVIDGYRQQGLVNLATSNQKRKLYISRRDANSRKFNNEDEIVELVKSKGFEVVELSNYGFIEKIKLLREAEYVVGLAGAGLCNIMFCDKNTKLIEIFPSSFVNYTFTSIAAYLEFEYQYIVVDNESLLSNINRYYGNFDLDINVLQNKLDQ